MRRHPIPVVAACIVDEDMGPPSVLLHQKNESHDEKGIQRNPELVGKWEFPGGIIEGKESPGRALIREIREELNISITVGQILYAKTVSFKDKKPYLVLFYLCHTTEALPEGCKYVGVFENLEELDILPGDLEAIEYIKELYN